MEITTERLDSIGQITWTVPEAIAKALEQLSVDDREAIMNTLRNQMECFCVIVSGELCSPKLLEAFDFAIARFASQSAIDLIQRAHS